MTNLETQWIVGFVDGEGCFNLDVHLKADMRWGLQMQPEFTVVQHERDIQILHALKHRFQCGTIGINRKDETSIRHHYRVKNVKDSMAIIIPFFENHPLKTKKHIEFQRYRKICRLMAEGYHRESLANFLEIYDLGQALRIRNGPKRSKKDEKVQAVIANLHKRLQVEAKLPGLHRSPGRSNIEIETLTM